MTNRTEERAARTRQVRMTAGILGAFLLLAVGVGANSVNISKLSAQRDTANAGKASATAVATAQASIASQGKALAANVTQKCKSDPKFRAQNYTLCPQASQLATATPTVAPGPPGPSGRGIAKVQNIGGHLVVTLTDGTAIDAGRFVGASGKPGLDGRGIKQETIVNGHLVVSYTDGAIADVGQVVGSVGQAGSQGDPGRSVTGVSIDGSSHLIVSFSDGTTQDAGLLPKGDTGGQGPVGSTGPVGPEGDPGPACMPGYSPTQQPQLDGGSIEVCTSPPAAAPTS